MSDPKRQGTNSKKYRILALDGGGVRGLVTAVWLHQLEKELGEPIYKHFDLVAGTSTGSILACAIALGKPTEQLVQLYKKRGKEIFHSSWLSQLIKWNHRLGGNGQPIYDGNGLEKVLREEFSNGDYEYKFGDIRKFGEKSGDARPLTFAVSYDTLNRRAVCFNSKQCKYDDIPIWEICKASSSAPFFFPAHVMNVNCAGISYKAPLIDGGVVASNPTACAIAEGMKDLKQKRKEANISTPVSTSDMVVVSLGTGDASHPIHINQIERWGLIRWMFNITGMMFDGSSQAMDHVARNFLEEGNYFRFQARLEHDSLDDVSDTNLNALHAFADSYFTTYECKSRIRVLKEQLGISEKVLDSSSCSEYDCASKKRESIEQSVECVGANNGHSTSNIN